MLLSKGELAEAIGVSRLTVENWIGRGCPVTEKGSRGRRWALNPADVVAWLLARDRNGTKAPDLTRARAELAQAQAEKAKLELATLRGRLIPADKIERAWSDLILAFRSRALAIPKKLAPRVSEATTAEAERILEEEIHEALAELAAGGGRPRKRRSRAASPKRRSKGRTTPKADRKRVGGSRKKTQQRKRSRTRKVDK